MTTPAILSFEPRGKKCSVSDVPPTFMSESRVPRPAAERNTCCHGIANSIERPRLPCENDAEARNAGPTTWSSTVLPSTCTMRRGLVLPSHVAQKRSGAKPVPCVEPVVSNVKYRRHELIESMDWSPRLGVVSSNTIMLLFQITPVAAR